MKTIIQFLWWFVVIAMCALSTYLAFDSVFWVIRHDWANYAQPQIGL